MEEWKEYKLGDIISIKSGFAYKGKDIGFGSNFLLGMGCVSFKEKFLDSGVRLYNGECSDKYCVKTGDIVLATRQQSDNLPILGMPAIIPNGYDGKKIIVGANLYKVENKSDFDNRYLFWLLKSPSYIDYIKSCQTGTTVRMITKSNIESYTFRAPNLNNRNKIVSILSSLDDKIEVNRRINEQLEKLAQALFKSWFVDFEPFKDGEFVESELGMIPEGWKVGTLGNVADVVMGASPAGSSYNTEGNGSIFYQGRTDFGFRFPNVRMYTTEPKRFAESNSVLLSVRAPVGDVNIAFEKCCIGRGLASIKSNSNADSYTYYLMKSLKPVLDNYNNEGTVFGCINKDALNNLSIVVPTIEIIKEFERIVSCSDMEIRRRSEEITHLTNLRDTLLPKLMSGEIDVNEVKI